jgi:hypothetical protein
VRDQALLVPEPAGTTIMDRTMMSMDGQDNLDAPPLGGRP